MTKCAKGHKNKNLNIRLNTSFVLSQSSLIPGEMSVNMIMFGERDTRCALVTAECWGPPPYTDTEGGYGETEGLSVYLSNKMRNSIFKCYYKMYLESK